LDGEKERKRTDQSFLIEKSEIVDKGYDLSINRYKEIIYEKVEHQSPQAILDEIETIEREIWQELAELRGIFQ